MYVPCNIPKIRQNSLGVLDSERDEEINPPSTIGTF